jgi:Antibiotic biosynthesis monooxygenase
MTSYAALIEVDVTGIEQEAGLSGLRERIVPTIQRMPGFQGGVWLTGDDAGRGLSLTVWESEEAAEAMAERFGIGAGPQAGASVTRSEVREVAVTAGFLAAEDNEH